jgi:hypothetical protein
MWPIKKTGKDCSSLLVVTKRTGEFLSLAVTHNKGPSHVGGHHVPKSSSWLWKVRVHRRFETRWNFPVGQVADL